MSDFSEVISNSTYLLAPEVILTPAGPQRDQAMLVKDGDIVKISDAQEMAQSFPNIKMTQMHGQAIVPGFIDSHIHLGQGFGKAIIGGEPSQIWQRIWIPIEGNLNPTLTYICAKWMLLEALRGGFTSVVNFAITNSEKTEAIHKAAVDTGVRVVSTTGAIDKAPDDISGDTKKEFKLVDAALKRAETHLALCKKHDQIYPSLCVSGVQGASKELINELSNFCQKNGALFQMHANEHNPEVHASIVEYGRRPTEYIYDCGGLGNHTLLHHATIVTESEIELIRSTGTGVSYNPVASLWKGDAVAPAMAYAERGVRMGMGTDSTRSDGFRMLDAAEACQRIAFGMRVGDFSSGAGWTWVDMATRGSADVAGLGNLVGQLAEGFRADFLVLDMETPEVLPSWDFQWELVRLYNRDQIKFVVINGQLIMANGNAIGWDQEKFVNEELPKAIETVESADVVRRHGTSDEYRNRNKSR